MEDRHCLGRSDMDTSDTEGSQRGYENEASRKGICWHALCGLTQWGTDGPMMYTGKPEEENLENSTFVEKENGLEEHTITSESPVTEGNQKKRHAVREKAGFSIERWSSVRYEKAQKSMLEILEAEGAVFGKPISRQHLRVAARKRIGDTGLLDHLLKHIDGKTAPGGTKRFRRWHNKNGVMEYWLESADLDNIRKAAGVMDPYWTPSSGWAGDGSQLGSVPTEELKILLKAEMDKMKSVWMEEVLTKAKEEQDYFMKKVHEDLAKQNAIEERLLDIETAVTHMQGMFKDIFAWKAQVDQQLMEIKQSVSSILAKNLGALDPTQFFADNKQDETQGDTAAMWLDNSGLINVGQENMAEQKTILERVAKIECLVEELVSKKLPDRPNGTPDSVGTPNSKPEIENLLCQNHLFGSSLGQEVYNALGCWRPNHTEGFSASGNHPIIAPTYLQ